MIAVKAYPLHRLRGPLEIGTAALLLLALSFGVSWHFLTASGIAFSPGNAFAQHVASALNFRDALFAGQWLPRWQALPSELPDLPVFQYGGFLSAAAAQPFLAIGMDGANSVVLGLVALRLVGLMALYLAARLGRASPPSAYLGAAAYALTPYCISTLYGSADVPLAAAEGVLPLLVLGWMMVLAERRRAGLSVIAVAVVLLALAQPVYLLYGVILGAVFLVFAPTWADRLFLAGGLAVGLAAGAFQWYPDLISRGDLATGFVSRSPFLARDLSSLSGWFGFPAASVISGAKVYYFTLGFWTLPVLAGLVWCVAKGARRHASLPLLAGLSAFLVLAYSPVDVWSILPKLLEMAEFPYRLLAFAGLLTAVALPIVMPTIRWRNAALLLLLMVDSQLLVLSGSDDHAPLAYSNSEIGKLFSTMSDRASGPLTNVWTDGWLSPDNRVRWDAKGGTPFLNVVGSSAVPGGPVDIWLANPETGSSLTDKTAVGPGPFRALIPLPSTNQPVTLRVARFFEPHEANPNHRSAATSVFR